MKINTWTAPLLCVALSAGCTDVDFAVGVPEVPDTQDRSPLVQDIRAFETVRRVSLTHVGTLSIRQGSKTELRVRAQQVVLDHLATSVEDGELRIGFDGTFTLNEQLVLECILTVEALESIEIDGLWSVEAKGLDAGPLRVQVDGVGELALIDLSVPELTLLHSGIGEVSASGSATALTLELSGTASYQGRYLFTEDASATIAGSGSATVAARDSLAANIESTGSLYYFGDPVVTRSGGGSGRVTRQGS